MMSFFILLQCVLLFFMLFHDWIPIPPLNDIAALKQSHFNRLFGSFINGVTVFIPLILTLKFHSLSTIFTFYFILTIGTILSWWVPYFFGSSAKHKNHFAKFNNTHQILPPRGNNVRPNTLHIILHLQVWACLGFSIYYLVHC